MERISVLIITFLFLVSCKPEAKLSPNFRAEENLYYNKKREIPFDGIGILTYRSGQISNEIRFKKGIPNGIWRAYGYRGEIIQEGNYQPYPMENKDVGEIKRVKRVNICTTKEGNVKFIEIIIITNIYKAEIDKSNFKDFDDLIVKLRANNISFDTSLVTKIIVSNIEFAPKYAE